MQQKSAEKQLFFRRAQSADFEQLVNLQNANLASNLSVEQKRDGFLSVPFSAAQFENMNNNLSVIVGIAQREQSVKAFLCASTIEFNAPLALPKTMIDGFSSAIYDGKPVSEWSACVVGPACVDAAFRGQGVLGELYQCLYDNAPMQYELVTLFVSVDNPRSIKAHEKLSMQIIDEFEFNSRRYVTMAGTIRKR